MLATVADAVDAAAAAVERVVALSVAKAEAVVVDVAVEIVETVATLEERLAVVLVAPLSTPTTPVLSQRSVLKRL